MHFRGIAAALVGAALLVGGLVAAAPATAESATFDSWVESDDAAPFATTEGGVVVGQERVHHGRQAHPVRER